MMESSKVTAVGSREWWEEHIRTFGKERLRFEVRHDSEEGFLYVIKKDSSGYPERSEVGPETHLKKCFEDFGLFTKFISLEGGIKLGKDTKRTDLIAEASDGSHWIIECKIIKKEKESGLENMSIDVRAMGEAMGQPLLYCAFYKKKYKSLYEVPIMPLACSWLLGSGRSSVIEVCRRIGVSVINLEGPHYMPNGQALRIYYLDDASPRHFIQ